MNIYIFKFISTDKFKKTDEPLLFLVVITRVRFHDMWGLRLEISSSEFGKGCQVVALSPGPWCRRLDLLYLAAKLPLVGVMWRGYTNTHTDLRTIADRRVYIAF
jgi:hypothetical protein